MHDRKRRFLYCAYALRDGIGFAPGNGRSDCRVVSPMRLRGPTGRRPFILIFSQIFINVLLVLTAVWAFSWTDQYPQTSRLRDRRMWLLTIGVAGTGMTLTLGLFMLRIVAPRIHRLRRLVASVRSFQETGIHERIGDTAKDDVAVLANALDAGFSAIACRERDRQQFLAIVAHELKTPITTIQGYSFLLAAHPDGFSEASRAIAIIHRQSARLTRLIEALFLAIRVRSGNLHFQPTPFDMSGLVQRVLRDMEPLLCRTHFASKIRERISILGDEALLEHALWALFTCAAALSPEDSPVEVSFMADGCARLSVDIQKSDFPIPDVQELFMPFRSVEYETGAGIRAAIGLYLCREIVRVHNGQLHVREVSELHPEFVMELPI